MSSLEDNRPLLNVFRGWESQSATHYKDIKIHLLQNIGENLEQIQRRVRAKPRNDSLYTLRIDEHSGGKSEKVKLQFYLPESLSIFIPKSEAVEGFDWNVLCVIPKYFNYINIHMQRGSDKEAEKRDLSIRTKIPAKFMNQQISNLTIQDYRDAKRITDAIVNSL